MPSPDTLVTPSPRHPFVRRVRLAWRSLTGGSAVRDSERATLVACSGGADSAALVLALADRPIVVAHIVHDMRNPPSPAQDRDATAKLARSLQLPFMEAQVYVRDQPGNPEASARRARYDALNTLALEAQCPFVATAHHADDQLETLLLRLARGSGIQGLRGILPRRPLLDALLVRPMLGVTRTESEALCAACGYEWRVDATNLDPAHARAALRSSVIPALKEIDPRVLAGARRTAEQVRRMTELIAPDVCRLKNEAESVSENTLQWDRSVLRNAHQYLVGEVLHSTIASLGAGKKLDRAGADATDRVIAAIQDTVGGQRRLRFGPVEVIIERERVIVRRIEQ